MTGLLFDWTDHKDIFGDPSMKAETDGVALVAHKPMAGTEGYEFAIFYHKFDGGPINNYDVSVEPDFILSNELGAEGKKGECYKTMFDSQYACEQYYVRHKPKSSSPETAIPRGFTFGIN